MPSDLKPIEVWGKFGPNPPKVAMVLAALGLPYHVHNMAFEDAKKEIILSKNPNGRMPVIYDPNTDFTLWESGAIIEYIVEHYDKERRLSFEPDSKEHYLARQWLMFQVSGQGPYYGQASWFKFYHAEQLASAKERYFKEIHRVSGVLEEFLKKQKEEGKGGEDGPWLVGGKMSYADIAFLPWQLMAERIFTVDEFNPEAFPEVKGWIQRMYKNSGIKDVVDDHIYNGPG